VRLRTTSLLLLLGYQGVSAAEVLLDKWVADLWHSVACVVPAGFGVVMLLGVCHHLWNWGSVSVDVRPLPFGAGATPLCSCASMIWIFGEAGSKYTRSLSSLFTFFP
jgi:hypothetical protein